MKKYSFFLLVPLIFFLSQTAFSSECGIGTVFQETFHRTSNEPITEYRTFSSINGSIATIKLYNGGVEHNKSEMVTDATIRVNGNIIFDEMQFKKKVVLLEDQIELYDENEIEVYLEGKPSSKVTILIFNGDLLWLNSEFGSYMSKHLNPYEGDWVYKTGLIISLGDHDSEAYEHSVRSGIVTGPGLPEEGVKLYHTYPNGSFLRLYDYNPHNEFHYILDDATIVAIPDDAEYTFRLYAEDPDVVTLGNTPLCSFTEIIQKRPVLNAALDASMFPTLINPDTQCAEEWLTGGEVDAEWTNPADMEVDWATVSLWLNVAPWYKVYYIDITPGDTTLTIDATGAVWTNQLYMSGHDEYERRFSLEWLFYTYDDCP